MIEASGLQGVLTFWDSLNGEIMCTGDIRGRIRTGRVDGKWDLRTVLLSTVSPLAFLKSTQVVSWVYLSAGVFNVTEPSAT